MGTLSVNLEKIKQNKASKKDTWKDLMPVAQNPTGWWDLWIIEDEKKKQNQFFLMKSSIKLLLLFQPK